MAFCEQCGAKLTPGSRFCEECGAIVEDVGVESATPKNSILSSGSLQEIFKSPSWKDDWAQAALESTDSDLGLILTREEELLLQVDAGPVQLQDLMRDYIEQTSKRGVKYYYLNLDTFHGYEGDGSVDSVVAALRSIADVARPKYLFILGNEKVIDVARWDNEASDGDDVVESDLCYSTLDTNSPWNGQEYDFDVTIRVGRLPTYSGEQFCKFRAYFDAAMTHIGHMDRIVPYGLSALVWEQESNYEFGKTASRKVDVSPMVGCANVAPRMGFESNLLFFNLHGSNRAKYWYGQNGVNYPEAFSPSVLNGMSRPYFIGVEACYGARYLGGLVPEQSVLLMAMENKCISFLGSSRIAFGKSTPTGSCADLVVGSYVKSISLGESAGDAHMTGLKRLSEDWSSLDDADVKTMAEFSLYGDPSARKCDNTSNSGFKHLFSGAKMNKGLTVPMPDVARAIRTSLAEVDAKIEAIVDEYVEREILPEISGSIGVSGMKTKVVKMSRGGLSQKLYFIPSEAVDTVAKVYFDDEGRVHKALVSK